MSSEAGRTAPYQTSALTTGASIPLLAGLAPLIWGSTYLVTTELLPADRPLLAGAMRALPAGLVLTLRGGSLPRRNWVPKVLVLGTLNIGAFFTLLFVAAYRLPGGIAAVIGALQPLLVLAIGLLWLRVPVLGIQLTAAVSGAVGVAMLVLDADTQLDGVGILAATTATTCMATGTVLIKRWGRPPGVDLLTFSGWQLSIGGLTLLPLAAAVEGLPQQLTAANIGGFAYLSILGALVAYPLWFWGVERLAAPSVSLLLLMSPLTAIALGYLALGQSMSAIQVTGALIVLASIRVGQGPAQPSSPSPRVDAL